MTMRKLARPTGDRDPVKVCVDHFYRRYVERFNPPEIAEQWLANLSKPLKSRGIPPAHVTYPRITGGKDPALLKQMIATWSEDGVKKLIDRMFGDAALDPRVIRSNQDIGALYSLANYLNSRNYRVDTRTAGNLAAAMRATERRKGQ